MSEFVFCSVCFIVEFYVLKVQQLQTTSDHKHWNIQSHLTTQEVIYSAGHTQIYLYCCVCVCVCVWPQGQSRKLIGCFESWQITEHVRRKVLILETINHPDTLINSFGFLVTWLHPLLLNNELMFYRCSVGECNSSSELMHYGLFLASVLLSTWGCRPPQTPSRSESEGL